LAAGLALFGIALWIMAIVLHVTPANARDVNFSYFQARMLGIVTGGAAVTAGIVLLAAG
jgi:hypothetical protein